MASGGLAWDIPPELRAGHGTVHYNSDEDLWRYFQDDSLISGGRAIRIVPSSARPAGWWGPDDPGYDGPITQTAPADAPEEDRAVTILRARVEEDPRCAGRLSRIALDVRIGRYAPLGLYDIIVPLADGSSATLREQVNLIVIEYIRPGPSGEPKETRYLPVCEPHPTITLHRIPSPSDIELLDGGKARARIGGTVRDALAEIVKNGEADITEIKVFANGASIGEIPSASIVRVEETPNLFRPYAHRLEFEGDIVFPLGEEGTAIRFVVENALGNHGSASLYVSAHKSGITQDGGITYNLMPEDNGDPAESSRLAIWIGERDVAEEDVRLKRASYGVFEGKFMGWSCTVVLKSTSPLNPGEADRFDAEIRLEGSAVAEGTFVEKSADGGRFAFFEKGISEPDGTLRACDVTRGSGGDPGSFAPFSIRISGGSSSLVLEAFPGARVRLEDDEYPIEEKAPGTFAITGSEVKVLIVRENTVDIKKGKTETRKTVRPADSPVKLSTGAVLLREMALMKTTDVLQGDEDVTVTVEIVGGQFEFKEGDAFRILPARGAEGDPLSPIAGTVKIDKELEKDKPCKARISGKIAKVTLPIGEHDVELTTSGRTERIAKAIEVMRPVRLIIANFYGDPPDAEQLGFDDHMYGSAVAMKEHAYKEDLAHIIIVRISSPTGSLRPKKGDIRSMDRLLKHALTPKDQGGLGLKPGTVISVDTLGHGTPATGHFESGLKIVVTDPDNAANTVVVPMRAPPANVKDGWLSDETYAEFFGPLLARTRRVRFNLWHCFAGDAGGGNKRSQVERLYKTFAEMKLDVAVQGFTGIVSFPAVEHTAPDGTKSVRYSVPYVKEAGLRVVFPKEE
ncbi:MAG: hypothetical protein N3A38_04235 [Planctomycetota bacterium]|nr:hypothetical protein [Planctomycetota bacterium]